MSVVCIYIYSNLELKLNGREFVDTRKGKEKR